MRPRLRVYLLSDPVPTSADYISPSMFVSTSELLTSVDG